MKKVLTVCLMLLALTAVFAGGSSESNAEYAMILKTQTTDFWVKMWKGIEAEAEALGIEVDLFSAASEDDLEGQLAILEQAISRGYKGIGIAPISGVNVISGVSKAYKAGIKVVDIDETIDPTELAKSGGAVVGWAATDNIAVGAKGGQYLVDNLPQGSKVLIIEGKSGNQSSEDRVNGAKGAVTSGGLKLVGSQAADWDRQTALDIANTYIQQNPDLRGIYCANDNMALGAVQAVKNAGLIGQILVVGTDGDSEAVHSVADGILAATVGQDSAEIGATCLRLLDDAVKNDVQAVVGQFPEKTPVESILITKENAAEFF